MRTGNISHQAARAVISNATTTSVTEKIGNASSAGDNRTHSDGKSRENKGNNGMLSTEDRCQD